MKGLFVKSHGYCFHGSSGRTLCRPENFPARQRRGRPGHAKGFGRGQIRSLKLLWLAGAVLLANVLTANGQELFVQGAELVGYGVFESRKVGNTIYGASTIPQDMVANVSFTDFTTEIPAKLGTEFGFQYIINSQPKGGLINVTYVIRFPEPGLVRNSGKVYKDVQYSDRITIGEKTLHGYGFDRPWEMVPGEWVFEVWHKKARLLRKTFTVLAPAAT